MQHQEQLTYTAAKYYAEHLHGTVPIVLVTENASSYASFPIASNVSVMSAAEYLERFWAHLAELRDLFASLRAAIEAIRAASSPKEVDVDIGLTHALESVVPLTSKI